MQVTELDNQNLKKTYKVVIAAEQINKDIETELLAAGEKVKIPGFRPGNIPLKVLQQRYGKSVRADIAQRSINQAVSKLVQDNKLRPAMTPTVDSQDFPEDGALTFTVTLELLPEVPELTFDGISIDRPIYEIEEAKIDEALTTVAARNASVATAEEGAKAKLGQIVRIDFKGMIDGVAFAGGTASDVQLELGSGQFIPGFEDQLVGCKTGDDRIVKVTFPADYHSTELAGKEASFAVTVKEVLNKEPAKVDDALAQKLGFPDLKAVREAISSQMKGEYDGIVRNKLKKQLFDALEKLCTFELPPSMLDMEFNSIWEQIKQSQGDAVDSDEALKAEYRDVAKRRVKLGILLADIGTRNKLTVSREELSRAVMQQASQYPGQESQVIEFYNKNPNYAENLRGPILEEKAVDFILGSVKFNDKKVSLAELVADDADDAEDAAKAKTDSAKESKPKAKKKASGE